MAELKLKVVSNSKNFNALLMIVTIFLLLFVSLAITIAPSFLYSYSAGAGEDNLQSTSLGEVYISGPSNAVTVINGTKVLTSIEVGSSPLAQLAYAPNVKEIFVPISDGSISVISAMTNEVVGSISGFNQPIAAVYVPLNKAVYLSDWSGRRVYAINTTTLSVFGNISIPDCRSEFHNHECLPWFMAYSPATRELYVVDFNLCSSCDTGNVTIIDPLTNKVVGNLPALYEAAGIGYDPANKDIYVANSDGTWVFNDRNQLVTILGNLSCAYSTFAYNPSNRDLYAASDCSPYSVYLIRPNNSVIGIVKVTHLRFPNGIAYDASNGLIYASAVAVNGSEWALVVNGTKEMTYVRCECFWGVVAS